MKQKTMADLPSILPKTYISERMKDLRTNGLPKGLYTGIDKLDNVCRFDKSRLITVTGIPGHGKSEFVDFLTTTYNKRYGMKTLYFSPENLPVEMHVDKIIRKYTCKKTDDLSEAEYTAALNYVEDNFFFINGVSISKLDDIINTAQEIIEKEKISILVIDPYNRVEGNKSSNELETNYIGGILDGLSKLAINYGLMLFLVAHPTKMERRDSVKEGALAAYKMPSAYDINGSANFYNKSDFVMVVHRNDIRNTETTIKIDKVKFKNYGDPGLCKLEYDVTSGNYYYDDKLYHVDELLPLPFVFPHQDAERDPLDVEVSLYKGKYDNIGTTIKLKDFLFSSAYKNVANAVRSGKTPEERHDLKEKYVSDIPCVTVSGLFSKRDTNNLIQPSGLLCVDIDLKDNRDIIDKIPDIIRGWKHTLFAAKSISGDGYFAVVKIDRPEHFLAHFKAIEQELKEIGIVIDKNCCDITRLRFASYDEDPFYNPSAISYYYEYKEPTASMTNNPSAFVASSMTLPWFGSATETLDNRISTIKERHLLLPDDYNSWFELGMSLSTLGEEGRGYFHELSSLSPKYNYTECDKQFNEIISHYKSNNHYTIGTAIKMLNDVIQ